jgi:uncharacterized protein YkwD
MRRRSRRTPLIVAALTIAASVTLSTVPQVSTAEAHHCRFANREAKKLRTWQARKAVRCVVNRHRRAHGVGGLSSNYRLRNAASWHTWHMTATNCFAHQCPGEGSLAARLWNVGYLLSGLNSWAYGESIAWGRGGVSTPRRVVRAWMNSPPHRSIILSWAFDHIGVGFDDAAPTAADSRAGTYTVDLGYRR